MLCTCHPTKNPKKMEPPLPKQHALQRDPTECLLTLSHTADLLTLDWGMLQMREKMPSSLQTGRVHDEQAGIRLIRHRCNGKQHTTPQVRLDAGTWAGAQPGLCGWPSQCMTKLTAVPLTKWRQNEACSHVGDHVRVFVCQHLQGSLLLTAAGSSSSSSDSSALSDGEAST